MRRTYEWGQDNIWFGLRSILGLVFIAGGILGFLPVLGFWMIPLGLVLISLDIPPLRRWLRSRLHEPRRSRGDNGRLREPGKREKAD